MIWRDAERQGEHQLFDESEPTEAAPYQGCSRAHMSSTPRVRAR